MFDVQCSDPSTGFDPLCAAFYTPKPEGCGVGEECVVGKGKRETKSPIKNLPVRQPGQSIRGEIERIIDDQALPVGQPASANIDVVVE